MKQKFVLRVEIKEFYIPPEDPGTALVITRDDTVLDSNKVAVKRGVQRGMPLHQAKAILQGARFVKWEPDDYAKQAFEWLDLCIGYSDIIEPHDQHAASLDLSAHPDPITVADDLVRALAKHTRLTIQSGSATAKWIAQLAVKHRDCGLALRDPKQFLAGLSVMDLQPVPAEYRQRLQFLGYSKIGDVAEIPFPVLQEQFDEWAHLISSAANGVWNDPVQACYPPQSCMAKLMFDGLAESTLIIENGLENLAQQLARQLELQSLEGNAVTMSFEDENSLITKQHRIFSKPLRDYPSVLASLKLLAEKAMDQPLISIHVLISELRKIVSVQAAFLDGTNARAPQRLQAAIKRVRSVFGDDTVKLGNEIQLPRRVRVLREWRYATGWR